MILVTGGTGFLGSALTARFREQGIQYEFLLSNTGKPFRLGDTPDQSQTKKATCLIHLAWERPSADKNINESNVRSTTELLSFCNENDIRFIFISSYAVLFSPQTIYATSKKQTETAVRQNGGFVIRPALVISDPPESSLRQLTKAVRIFRLLPDRADNQVFIHTVSLRQFTQCCINYATSIDPPPLIHNCAEMRPVSLSSLVQRITKHRIVVLKLPSSVIRRTIRTMKWLPLATSTRDSIDGLYGSTTTVRDLMGSHGNFQ